MSHSRLAYPLAVRGVLRLDDLKRFLKFVEQLKIEKDMQACWIWTGHVAKNGYGHFYYKNESMGAHRFAYAAFVGDIGEAMTVHHECSCRRCVNPAHLSLASLQVHGKMSNGNRWNKNSAEDLPV